MIFNIKKDPSPKQQFKVHQNDSFIHHHQQQQSSTTRQMRPNNRSNTTRNRHHRLGNGVSAPNRRLIPVSEYKNLRQVVPSLRRQRDVGKVEVVVEAARYIDHLHKTLIERFMLCGIPDSMKDFLGTDNAKELNSSHIMQLVARMAANERSQTSSDLHGQEQPVAQDPASGAAASDSDSNSTTTTTTTTNEMRTHDHLDCHHNHIYHNHNSPSSLIQSSRSLGARPTGRQMPQQNQAERARVELPKQAARKLVPPSPKDNHNK